jgi:hypothetical protein
MSHQIPIKYVVITGSSAVGNQRSRADRCGDAMRVARGGFDFEHGHRRPARGRLPSRTASKMEEQR